MTANNDMKDISEAPMMRLKVSRKTFAAQDIAVFELVHPDQQALPEFTAGAHVCVMTPSGMLRRYSLCNPPSERDRYVIAVKRDADGGGGSVSMVDKVAAGDLLQVSQPENYFSLVADAARHLLIAGGIGITPILSMAHHLRATNADFRLVYCSRTPETTAFLDELSSPDLAGRAVVHHDHGDPARSLAIDRIIAEQTEGTHVYCCGPRGLMQCVRELTRDWPSANVHFEDFGTSAHADAGGEKPFSVHLARANVTLRVDPGVSILEAMRERGLEAPSSCESGTCGSCRTRLLAGVAEHRDFILDEDEYDSQIMICVSRAQSEELVLDL